MITIVSLCAASTMWEPPPVCGLESVRGLSITCNFGLVLASVIHDSFVKSATIPDDSSLCGLQDSSTDEEPIVQSEASSEWQGDLPALTHLASFRGSGLDSIVIDSGAGQSPCPRTQAQEHATELENMIRW